MRRVVDFTTAIFCLALVWPILCAVAILIKSESSGPILFVPSVVGQYGNVFPLLRFRTMSGQQLTSVGKFLRAYSLDHLPMLVNLLRGEVTLVGPRPMEVDAVDLQDPAWQRYVQAKPGLFNYAVLKLGKLWTPSRVLRPDLNRDLELEYLGMRSVGSDVQVVLRSLVSLVRSRGNIKERGEPDAEARQKLQPPFS